MSIEDSFVKLLGRQPSDAERQNLYRVRDALGLKNNDALWLILIALQHYERLYAGIPLEISKASNEAAKSAAAQAQADVNRAVAGLIPSLKEAVAAGAREALAFESVGKSMMTMSYASVITGLIFGAGLLYGARIFAAAASGQLTWAAFWSNVGWSLVLGSIVPGLIMLTVARFGDEKQWWQWLAGAIALIAILVMILKVFQI